MGDAHVLVTGATGLVGRAAVEHFSAAGWRVTAAARRRPFETYGAEIASVDLTDAAACVRAFASAGFTHLVYAAVQEQSGLVDGWTASEHVEANAAMLRNVVEAIDSPTLRHVSIVQGPKAYGVHVGSRDVPAREASSERRDIPNFYWAQQDWLAERQRGRDWSWTVFRPGMVIGEAIGSSMNTIAVLGVYGAVLRARGEPLHYPGWVGRIGQPTDTALMASAFEWAAGSDAAANQVFNITDGEVIGMRSLWPTIASALGMAAGEDRRTSLADFLSSSAAEWDSLRAAHGLRSPDLATFLTTSPQLADFSFGLGETTVLPQGLMSDVKLRAAGFVEVLDSETAFTNWFRKYQEDGLLPPP